MLNTTAMKHPLPSGALGAPSGSHIRSTPQKAAAGIGGLPGGVVGPEAAGLDPAGPEHFFVTLAAYADALDALPLDLTRSFSDLRELDAVLGSHLNSLTARLNHLTALIEDPEIDQGQRLLALKEVAEEARAYKMGGEDKIRAALNTAETIISHTDYIDALVEQLDRFPEISPLLNPTKHLNLEQYYVRGGLKNRELIATLDGANAVASSTADLVSVSGSKKKKVAAANAAAAAAAAATAAGGKGHKTSDNVSVAGSTASGAGASSSKKRKAISSAAVSGSGAGASSKVARTNSSTGKGDEDVKAATNGSSSHKKKGESASNGKAGGQAGGGSGSSTRLPRAAHAHGGIYTEDDEEGTSGSGARKEGAGRRGAGAAGGDGDDGATGSSARSRSSRAVRNSAAAHRSDEEDDDPDDGDHEEEDEAPARAGTKSRGRTNNRASTTNSRARGGAGSAAAAAAAGGTTNSPHTGGATSTSVSRGDSPSSTAGGAGDDADEARYCFCNNVSYGDMIGCDDDDCEREWFHLGCVGLTKPPQGTWYCEACLERRASNGRSKAKKSKSSAGSKKVRR
ncbi:hypothetical protein BCV70DRAFT_12959 [Testicularia cyperi]|uniref:Chromatin modification-related protein n=1 Tax=Testicularia cyperi TaxID=1882483 RepID=A0A317XZ62_9BASI|nr:hypothetical protein BCV70DRAFT_12959 [Testicularia cyperi]